MYKISSVGYNFIYVGETQSATIYFFHFLTVFSNYFLSKNAYSNLFKLNYLSIILKSYKSLAWFSIYYECLTMTALLKKDIFDFY